MFKLFRYFRGKPMKSLLWSLLWMLLSSIFNIFQPLFLMGIVSIVPVISHDIDSVSLWGLFTITSNNAWMFYWLLCGLMVVTSILGLACGFGSFYGSAKASLLCVQNIRNAAYQQILTYSFSEFDHISTASLITRLTNDAQKIQQVFQMIVSSFLYAIAIIIGGSIVAFTINVIMGAVSLSIVALIIVLVALLGVRIMPMFNMNQTAIDDTSSMMRENILGVRVVKSFNLQDSQIQEYDYHNSKQRRASFRGLQWLMPLTNIVQFGINFGIICIMVTGGLILKSGNSPQLASQIYGAVQVMVMVLSSSIMACMVIANVIRTEPSFRRINEIIHTNSSIVSPKNPNKFNHYDIKFDHVNFKYTADSKEYVLKDINLEIKEGETLGIIGGTGSGKSTLINLIPRLYDVTKGKVTIGDIDVRNLSVNDLRTNIHFAIQEQTLFAGDIKYNLRYGLTNATNEQMVDACKQACAWEFVSQLPRRLEAPVEQRGRNFSGGQKQRLCLARAIIGKPKILILDDTTSALDLLTEKTVQTNLANSLPDTTKIIVSQRISSIMHADHILVLKNGTIDGYGSHNELIKSNSLYHDIAQTQLKQTMVE